MLTERSENPSKAYVRYSMTGFYLDRLYQDKPWQTKTSVQNVNGFHSAAAKKFRKMNVPELET